MLRLFAALAASSCLLTGLAATALAQGSQGLTIFSGVSRENQLSYRFDYYGRPGTRDRYYLNIPATKMNFAVAEFAVTYPETYRGRLDPDQVEIWSNGEKVALDEVVWDQDNRVLEIYPQEPVPADTRVQIVLSNVRNPNRPGTHYFNALVRSPGDLPMLRYVGTWILSFSNQGSASP